MSLKEMHEILAFVSRVLLYDFYLLLAITIVNFDTFLCKLLYFIRTNFIVAAMPNIHFIFLSEFVIWLRIRAEHKHNIIILNVFIIENCRWILPVGVLE